MSGKQFFEREIELSALSEPPRAKFNARLAYETYGDASKPAVLLPTCFGGTLATTTPFLYKSENSDRPVFPIEEYFIIVTALLGGGESSSPSNTAAPLNGPNFPKVTYEDNVRLQHSLCVSLGVKELHAYIGFSMGGQQSYHFAALFPDFVKNIVCIAGSAKTSAHNWCFLEGPKHALIMSEDFKGGHYTEPVKRGTLAWSRVYSTWALSQGWFREKCWEQAGFKSLEEYLDAYWGGGQDANDLLALTWTWQHGDIAIYHQEDQNDLAKALRRIKARCLIMPTRTDQYFPPEDSEYEVKHLQHGELKVVETVWGHIAGGGSGTKEDTEFMKDEIASFLKRSA
ncbi:hypothetical protein AMS68_006801 [Peltaster fructicola]|uniref:AB hydrolase-1 domain-containing protein n=1 Tax=Peltaster fructicola TaxID=286661 RepID=A0A6H0Y2P8_9PEZI|nr:hypothetical protein AMS68_006801 [Peltaster fructicola]